MKGLLTTACLALLSVACGSAPTPDATTSLATETIESSERADTVEALRIDGIWVFQHEPREGGVALTAGHGGIAEIRDDCLYVDDAIVVWQKEQINQAAQTIADIQAGKEPGLHIAGGGISLEEGASPEDIPSIITERCATTDVWYQSLSPPTTE